MPSTFLSCCDCGAEFEITEGEMAFLASKMDAQGNPFSMPKRCKPCRVKKKARYASREKHQNNSFSGKDVGQVIDDMKIE